jgi:beta-hydroxylase
MKLLGWMNWLETQAWKLTHERFHKHSTLGDKPFFDPNDCPGRSDLEENYLAIREEVDRVMERYEELTPFQTMSPHQEYLSDDNDWKMFFLKCSNIRFHQNISLMPKTMAVVDRHPNIVSAYLSILGPFKALPFHRGPWSGILRAHLGLIIPGQDECKLFVDGHIYSWHEGEVVFFDDTFEHGAINPTNRPRVVLFMDVLRPMSQPWDWINRTIMKMIWLFPYVWIPWKRHRKWMKEFHKETPGP